MKKTFENFNYYKNLLHFLSNSKPKEIKSIIITADRKLIQLLCETTHNLLVGNIPISKENLEKLKKYKYKIRKLCNNSTLENKKKILGQNGGFLNILIPALITGITSLIETLGKE